MYRKISIGLLIAAWIALTPGGAEATTREIADLQPVELTFGQSILNQLSYDTYRDPFDELQTRPYNLLFTNIGRHPNLSPWQGQEGSYSRYVNALIGNNGAANVDNDADTIQGSMIRRETGTLAWGVSGAFLTGSNGSNDSAGTSTFNDSDDLSGFDLRVATAWQISERRVLGGGVRARQATRDVVNDSFELGVGGFVGADEFSQSGAEFDFGMRQFHGEFASWEVQAVAGFGTAEQDEFSETLDDTGAITDRFVITNYDISDMNVGIHAGYNRLRRERLGETEFRIGLESFQRELDNSDLAFSQTGGAVTPTLTLLGQDTISATEISLSAKTVFQAGQTEVFSGAQFGYSMIDGATSVDAAGLVVNEAIDDTSVRLGLTVGFRQPIYNDHLRFIVSGRADLLDEERTTTFDTGSDGDDVSQTTAQYAIGLEGALANVAFDIAWLFGEEAPVVPVGIGLPTGSRRSVEFDRLVFSAAVSW